MAVPKKRTSKSKKNIRKANWKKKADSQTKKAFSLPASKSNKRRLNVNR
nr:ribosomal protein L32 [Phyllosiphon coccidium]WDY12739.1 ribosomal protein L32 [Phyllosiphon coccidium]